MCGGGSGRLHGDGLDVYGDAGGLAGRLTEGGGALQVVGTCAKTRGSLEDLGLDFLMEIEPAGALWCGQEEGVRAVLDGQGAEMKAGSALHSSHVLEAHQTLSDANDGNREKFSGVLKVLGEELSGLSAVPRSGG